MKSALIWDVKQVNERAMYSKINKFNLITIDKLLCILVVSTC